MKEPIFLGIAAEFEISNSLLFYGRSMVPNDNGKFLRESNDVVDIRGSTEEFYGLLRTMEKKGCDQSLISYLKKARDMGAAWVFFKPTEDQV